MQINSFGSRVSNWNRAQNTLRSKVEGNVFSDLLEQSKRNVEDSVKQGNVIRNTRASSNVEFSGSYEERLEQISKLNAETDWSSMSDLEKVRVFEERYERAFPDSHVISAGLYLDYSPRHKAISDHRKIECEKIFGDNGSGRLNSDYAACYREINYGNMTDEEVRAAIREKYQGSGSMEDRCVILQEYFRCGVDREIDGIVQHGIEKQIFKQVEDTYKESFYGTGKSVTDSPRFLDWYMSYAKGVGEGAEYKPNWTQISQGIIDSFTKYSDISREKLEELKDGIDEFLNEILGG